MTKAVGVTTKKKTAPITIGEMILSLIRGYSLLNHKTILITTHDNRILSIADRIIQVQQQIP